MDTSSATASRRPLAWTDWLALRRQRLEFRLRVTGLQLQRAVRDALHAAWRGPLPRLERMRGVDEAHARLAFVRATSITSLWTQGDAREWRLTAGKVHNLRAAARALDGLVVPAGAVFSFWQAVGRPLASRGYVAGRELREGCLVASTGGGLCQLSNALYSVALDAGARIVERHAHSRVLPGSQAAVERDATVFWNHVDLRFSMTEPFELEVSLDPEHLVVRLRAQSPARRAVPSATPARRAQDAPRPRDCDRCERSGCPDRRVDLPMAGRTCAVVPAAWPEHRAWAQAQSPSSLLLAEEATGWRVQASRILAWCARRRPAARRRAGLAVHDARALAWVRTLGPLDTTLIVPLDWLAALACAGVLQGRRYSVLMTRWPLAVLHQRLDAAAARLPLASLQEFRASPARVAAEWQALQGAAQLVTPHAELADRLTGGSKAEVVRLAWQSPPARPHGDVAGRRVLFPAAAMARMGAIELRTACRALGLGLDVLGRAEEDPAFWHGLDQRRADPRDPWRDIGVVVLPAWVESAPRLLLEALARGLPVIATSGCGLPAGTPGCRTVPAGDAAALTRAMAEVMAPSAAPLPLSRRA